MKTKEALEGLGKWEAFDSAKSSLPSYVTDAAAAISASDAVRAGFVWDTTARQFGLKIHELNELEKVRSAISVNLISTSNKPKKALLFAHYLASPQKGGLSFKILFFRSRQLEPLRNFRKIEQEFSLHDRITQRRRST